MLRCGLAFLLVVGFVGIASGPAVSQSQNYSLSQYISTTWDVRDALPSNAVTDILQHSSGYIWITTFGALVRFDGVRFQSYRAEQTGIMTNTLSCIIEGADGAIWVGSHGNGLIRYSQGAFRSYAESDGLVSQTIFSLHEDESQGLLVGTNQGVMSYAEGRFTRPRWSEPLLRRSILAMARGREGLYFSTKSDGLWRLDDAGVLTPVTQDGTPFPEIRTILPTPRGLLFGSVEGLLWQDLAGRMTQLTIADGLPNNSVQDLLLSQRGAIWIATARGVARWDWQDVIGFPEMHEASDRDAQALMQDREGSLWIGYYKHGLQQLSTGLFLNYRTSEGLPSNVINAIHPVSSDGDTLLIATDDGMALLENGLIQPWPQASLMPGSRVRDVTGLSDGSVWIATFGGFLVVPPRGRPFTLGPEQLRDGDDPDTRTDRARFTFESSQGEILLATNKGLFRYEGEGKVSLFLGKRHGLPADLILSITEVADGSLWIGTQDGLVNWKDDRLRVSTLLDGLPSNLIFKTAELEGALIVGTNAGLAVSQGETFRAIDGAHPLYGISVYETLIGESVVWFTTGDGLYRAAIEAVREWTAGDSNDFEVEKFGITDGLPTFECTGNSRALLLDDDRLMIPTTHGLAIFDGNRPDVNPVPPPVRIESLMADGDPTDLTAESIVFAPDVRRLRIGYTGLSYRAPHEVQFRYRLEGFDADWEDVGTNRTAEYTNLPAGDYTFQVIGANADGIWNRDGTSLAFTVQPTWYERPVVQLLMAALALFLAFSIYQWRVRSLRRRSRVLAQTVQERTADLETEKTRSEALLFNILPNDIALELRSHGVVAPKRYDPVTVLFADFENFTQIAAAMTSDDLVNHLNQLFGQMDDIMAREGLEKIKTIGDAYMAVAGIPKAKDDHASRAARAALSLHEMVREYQDDHDDMTQTWNLRIGIHSGHVIGGVVGKHKYTFDVWGHTVNVASRLEQLSAPGTITTSEETGKLLSDTFLLRPKGEFDVKGVGPMRCYTVERETLEFPRLTSGEVMM